MLRYESKPNSNMFWYKGVFLNITRLTEETKGRNEEESFVQLTLVSGKNKMVNRVDDRGSSFSYIRS